MKSEILQELEKLYTRIGRPEGVKLFCTQRLADCLEETITLFDVIVPVIVTDRILEHHIGENKYQSDVYLSNIDLDELEEHL